MDCQNLPGKLNCEMNHIRICLTTLSTSQWFLFHQSTSSIKIPILGPQLTQTDTISKSIDRNYIILDKSFRLRNIFIIWQPYIYTYIYIFI